MSSVAYLLLGVFFGGVLCGAILIADDADSLPLVVAVSIGGAAISSAKLYQIGRGV